MIRTLPCCLNHYLHASTTQRILVFKPNRRMSSATVMPPPPQNNVTTEHQGLVDRLSRLDTALLCDADKTLLLHHEHHNTADSNSSYNGLRLMTGLKPLNHACDPVVMVGFAHTVQFTTPNDFLPVLRGLAEAQRGQVLVVNTLDSTRAVAGGLFGQEALQKGLGGIVVDGPTRDVASLANPPDSSSTINNNNNNMIRVFAKSVTPYSGTIQSPGETQCSVQCGGVTVHQNDIVVGDADGIVVGSIHTFSQLVQVAEDIQKVETALVKGMENGTSLPSMTNLEQHLKLRLSDKESNLSFLLDPLSKK
mmetsp:Transcript_6363/g.11333  ORF Transcript_6363/g.11333 Transcript_6363/m.11333 type:complete len:307 (-) Transcript_6363:1673-2593(-)